MSAATKSQTSPTVFISYSWDDEPHQNWILTLSKRLISNGINVLLDRYELAPGKNIIHFMETAIAKSNKVIIVFTPNYKRKADKRKGGVGYEYSILNIDLYKSITTNKKYIPVLRAGSMQKSIPSFMQQLYAIDMTNDLTFEETFKKLVLAVYDKPEFQKPDLGSQPKFERQVSDSKNVVDEESILTASKNALIILEIGKLNSEFRASNWKQREHVLAGLNKYVDHSNIRLASEIFQFLEDAAVFTRTGMPYNCALEIEESVLNFFPAFQREEDRDAMITISRKCINIGDNIAYDAFIHLRNLSVAMVGLSIIKFIYREANSIKFDEIKDEVLNTYTRLESTLKRPERNDLGNARELLGYFKEDLSTWEIAYPPLPVHLMDIFEKDQTR